MKMKIKQVETVFVTEDSVDISPMANLLEVKLEKLKFGEIFHLRDNSFTINCIHCLQEFQHFTEFTLHIEEHYLSGEVERLKVIEEEEEEDVQIDTKQPMAVPVKKEENIEIVESADAFSEQCYIECHYSTSDEFEDETAANASLQESSTTKKTINEPMASKNRATGLPPLIEGKDYKKVGEKLKCLTCGNLIKTRSDMREHLYIHTNKKNVLCPLCMKAFLTVSYVRKHIHGVHNQSYSNETIREAQKLLVAQDLQPDENEKQALKSKEISIANIKTEVKIVLKMKDKQFSCLECSKYFAKPRYVQKHMRCIHGKHCPLEAILVGQKELEQKLESTEGDSVIHTIETNTESVLPAESINIGPSGRKFECFQCCRQYSTIKTLRNHMQLHSGIKYTCPLCDKLFSAKNYLSEHIRYTHGTRCQKALQRTTEIVVDFELPKKSISAYECYLCKKPQLTRYKMRTHMYTHTMEPLLCVICGTVCKSKDTLRHHMERHNADPHERHKCNFCDKTYPTRRYMLNHQRIMHKSGNAPTKAVRNRTHKCEVCGKMFRSNYHLNQHMRYHNNDPKDMICHICGWEFHERGNLNQHLDTHSNSKKYKCEICNKLLSIRYAREHMKIHSGEKEHVCATCGNRFLTKERLKRHMIRHVGLLKYKCDLCGKAYSRSDKLLYHRRTHAQSMNYVCRTCNQGFISFRSLRHHENKHKPSIG